MPSPNSNDRRITFDQLQKRAADGSLSDDELRDYFEVDEKNSKPFAPAAKLNREFVDTKGKRPSARVVSELLLQAEAARATRQGRFKTGMEAAAAELKVLSEGDSWFNLPFWYPPTAIDILDETHDVGRIAKWSAEIAVMVSEKQYLVGLGSGLYRHFLFSGGGNDVLGAIPTYVKKKNAAGTDPANAASYIKPTFDMKIKKIIGYYKTLAADVRGATQPDAVLYVHGYANAIPKTNGKYLGRPLAELGFDPLSPLAKAIVAQMVKAFNDALRAFAASQANVVYVDMRPAMSASDWHTDEIHPKKSGSKKIATRFANALAANTLVA